MSTAIDTGAIEILDHGYLRLVDRWGSDESIVEAARMSTARGFLGWGQDQHDHRCPHFGEKPGKACDACGAAAGDEKLLHFLYENKHATPFEMAGVTIEVQAPIFVFREWHRHRTQSYNEMSARYIPLPDVNYIPSVERLMMRGTASKQAGTIDGAEELTDAKAEAFRRQLATIYDVAELAYRDALLAGIPKELARVHLPVGRYSRMRASANLRNWLGFLTLRMAPGAQWEIRQYANAMSQILAKEFPRTHALFAGARGSL